MNPVTAIRDWFSNRYNPSHESVMAKHPRCTHCDRLLLANEAKGPCPWCGFPEKAA